VGVKFRKARILVVHTLKLIFLHFPP